jgi:CDP-diacylglycerol--glycerol-3-phosphate 3-phosphatidyltransferase
MIKSVPNILTICRILLIPVLIASFYLEGKTSYYVATAIFIFASITDYFDGFIAKLYKAQSEFGRMLDPIADKMLVASALVMLIHFDRVHVLPAIAILCREILVSGMREYMAELKVSIPVSNLAKAKTATQMIAISLLLLGDQGTGFEFVPILGAILIWLAAILTIFTGYLYCKQGFKQCMYSQPLDNN